MQLLSLTTYQGPPVELGQFSDLRDRQVLPGPQRWAVVVVDDVGHLHALDFDHNPTHDEIAALVPVPQDLNPTASKAVLLPIVKQRIAEAQAFDWFNTKAQADGSLTAGQKTAVGNLNTQLYQRARAALGAWAAAQ